MKKKIIEWWLSAFTKLYHIDGAEVRPMREQNGILCVMLILHNYVDKRQVHISVDTNTLEITFADCPLGFMDTLLDFLSELRKGYEEHQSTLLKIKKLKVAGYL